MNLNKKNLVDSQREPTLNSSNFSDVENIDIDISNSFCFKTKSSKDLVEFTFSLLVKEGKLIKLSNTEQKLPLLNFKIDILK